MISGRRLVRGGLVGGLLIHLVTGPFERASAQTADGARRMTFEVAAVRQNRSEDPPRSNFPLNPGPQYGANGGLLSATNMVLLQYIVFAYGMNSYQIQAIRAQLPDWARAEHFDIQARAAGEPTKDEMRAMMQSLLEERFRMRVHHELREVPVLALVPAKPGKTGPRLQVHAADDPTCAKKALAAQVAGAYPAACGAGASVPASQPGLTAIGGQRVTMADFVRGLTNLYNGVDRPVLDQTGLTGVYDFTLEWAPDAERGLAPGTSAATEPMSPTFTEALREQMGLKLVRTRGNVDVIVLDGVEEPG